MLTVGFVFFLAELGDKTMLATITLATREGLFGTWLGSTLGMVAADALAIGVGRMLGSRLPERTIRIGAAVSFFVFAALLLIEARASADVTGRQLILGRSGLASTPDAGDGRMPAASGRVEADDRALLRQGVDGAVGAVDDRRDGRQLAERDLAAGRHRRPVAEHLEGPHLAGAVVAVHVPADRSGTCAPRARTPPLIEQPRRRGA